MDSTSIILGIGGSSHDFSACLLKDGKVIIGIEQERLDRIKHSSLEWYREGATDAIEYCLTNNSYKIKDVEMAMYVNDLVVLPSFINNINSHSVGHHLAHAACSYYQAPFLEAAILIIDGHGHSIKVENKAEHMETISHGRGINGKIILDCIQDGHKKISSATWQYITANSLGSFFKVISDLLGFGMNGVGKVMGLSAYGSDKFIDSLQQFAHYTESGGFQFDPYGGIVEFINTIMLSTNNKAQVTADLAFAAQHIFTETVVFSANILQKNTGLKTLCYGGGCALNGLTNQKIIDNTDFEDIYIFPACGDAGLSFGAALWGWYNIINTPESYNPKCHQNTQAYTGKQYDDEEILEALNYYPVIYSKPVDYISNIVRRLRKGEIGALFLGGSEIGPRALGHRSIIADPGYPMIRQKINREIKHRESFRPLAPVVPYESVSKYFNFKDESPFMLRIAKVHKLWHESLEGAIHVDKSARLQTLSKNMNPFLYQLLIEFERVSGYAVLINTSFNMKNEPIVETPMQAIKNFIRMKLDFLYLDGYFVEKHTPWV